MQSVFWSVMILLLLFCIKLVSYTNYVGTEYAYLRRVYEAAYTVIGKSHDQFNWMYVEGLTTENSPWINRRRIRFVEKYIVEFFCVSVWETVQTFCSLIYKNLCSLLCFNLVLTVTRSHKIVVVVVKICFEIYILSTVN